MVERDMRSIMLSVRPKWSRKIAAGEKTIEVRKTAPKIPTPYKCYLYCTEQKNRADAFNLPITREEMLRDLAENGMKCMSKYANGKVWAEFICDKDIPIMFYSSDPEALVTHYEVPGTCLSDVEIMAYLGNGKPGHGLHISELRIYDKPRELEEFCAGGSVYTFAEDGSLTYTGMKRAPQNWCYVEDMKARREAQEGQQ